ncbi:MAG: hypothetical protein EON48_05695 [Acetobacteraceae bacterium]|nr:MAG: hypothetical protein EON48_05695 [Acetobacteraceae bacterium]
MKFLDPNDPFFAKPWVRWVTVLLPLGWAGFELWQGSPLWGVLFLAAGLYAGWQLFFNRNPD